MTNRQTAILSQILALAAINDVPVKLMTSHIGITLPGELGQCLTIEPNGDLMVLTPIAITFPAKAYEVEPVDPGLIAAAMYQYGTMRKDGQAALALIRALTGR